MSEKKYELCFQCDAPTGGAGKGEDSLYINDLGPFCPECYDQYRDTAGNFHNDLMNMGAGLLKLLAKRIAPEEFCDLATIDQASKLLAEIEKEKQG